MSQFVGMFDGMKGMAVRRDVLADCGLSRTGLSSLAPDGEPDGQLIADLHAAMASRAKVVPAKRLGLIGKDHLHRVAVEAGANPDTFRYVKVVHDDDARPAVTEIGFAAPIQPRTNRLTLYGVNWSAAIRNPFQVPRVAGFDLSLDAALGPTVRG